MKIDRLLGITIYLLNHKKVSSQVLADKFEVSVRTILRDIDTLCRAGIPVVSIYGVNGGYEILDTFKMERQIAGEVDYSYIVTALQGFATAYCNKELASTIEKMQALSTNNKSNVVLDFGVLSEKKQINKKLSILEQAMKDSYQITFTYTNADNVEKTFQIDPVVSMYKWYSWYLLGYYQKYHDYRIFKLERMDEIIITGNKNSMEHNAKDAIDKWEQQEDKRKYIHLKITCSKEVKVKCQEYLNAKVESELDNGDTIMTITVPENEQFGYGVLLSFGNKVKVLEPIELCQKICKTCQDILNEYKEL